MFSHANSDAARFYHSLTIPCRVGVDMMSMSNMTTAPYLEISELLKFPNRHRPATGTGRAAHLLRPPAPAGTRTRYRPGTGRQLPATGCTRHRPAPPAPAGTGWPPGAPSIDVRPGTGRHWPATGSDKKSIYSD